MHRNANLWPSSLTRVASPTCFLSPALVGKANPAKGGRAVFAKRTVGAGDTLAVWGGEVLTGRQLALMPRDARHRLCLQVEDDLFLFTTREGPADWINHSCSPNAGMRGQIVLVAMRDIASDEEICFDYAMTDSHHYDEFDCHCGAPECRGRVTGNDWRIPQLQAKYRGYFAPHIGRLIRASSEAREEDGVVMSI